ncbi:serine hydrolase [Xanthomonas citri pv. mangiferaeindicae]|nr:serine hydrolase [Xanthomonas citri pv. mangiferaeindicae]
MTALSALLALSIATGPEQTTPPAPALAARLDAVLDTAVQEQRIVGAVLQVERDGRTVYRRAVGQIDREAGRPMPDDAVFRLASVTKPIVTLAALRLVDQGRLRLDDPVTRWIPAFRPALADGRVPTITVHHLLTHSAGLGNPGAQPPDGPYHRLGVSDGLDRTTLTLAQNVQRIADAPLAFAPGTGWRYSLAIDVLGEVVAQAHGTDLPRAVADLVTGPLGMTDTAFWVPPLDRVAVPYVDGVPVPRRMTGAMDMPLPPGLGVSLRFDPERAFDAQAFASGGAGMLGTADDVVRALEVFHGRGPAFLQAATIAQARRDHVGTAAATQGPGWGFGYGGAVLVDPVAAATRQAPGTLQWGGVYGHTWFVDPANGLTVVLLTNTAFEGMSGALPREVRDAVYAGE